MIQPIAPLTPLDRIIRDIIVAEGAMSVARYMELALQHPEHGYYRSRDPLGAGGDFITAPEISQMFGEMLGLWCADTWQRMGKPETFALVELGAGRGTMLHDALRATAHIAGFTQSLRLFLLESNNTLRQMQAAKLQQFQPHHIELLDELPADMPLIVLANEFFDALPIHQMIKIGEDWQERMIGLDADKDRLVFIRPPLTLSPHLVDEEYPAGSMRREISPLAQSIVRQLSARIVHNQGAILICDYGYNDPANTWTLQAVAGHHSSDPLLAAGTSDITAHVDFASLRRAAESMGAIVYGACPQGEFLQAMGIELRAAQLSRRAVNPAQIDSITSALRRLTTDDEMGLLFKVMAMTSADIHEIAGLV